MREQVVQVGENPDGEPDPVPGAGRARQFLLTEPGRERLERLGVVLDRPGRRPLVRYCVDWSEQQPHIAGVLGAALLDLFIARRWVSRGARRVVHFTDAGRASLAEQLGVDAEFLMAPRGRWQVGT